LGTTKLASQYSISRDAIYRHAYALGLMDKGPATPRGPGPADFSARHSPGRLAFLTLPLTG